MPTKVHIVKAVDFPVVICGCESWTVEKEKATHSGTLPGKPHGQRRLVGYSPWGHKKSDMTE